MSNTEDPSKYHVTVCLKRWSTYAVKRGAGHRASTSSLTDYSDGKYLLPQPVSSIVSSVSTIQVADSTSVNSSISIVEVVLSSLSAACNTPPMLPASIVTASITAMINFLFRLMSVLAPLTSELHDRCIGQLIQARSFFIPFLCYKIVSNRMLILNRKLITCVY